MRARPVPVIALVIAALTTGDVEVDAGPRPGKVVRVDRPRRAVRAAPRLCQLAPRELRGQCFGAAPAIGELASVIDDAGVLAQLRVVSAQETRDPCGNVSLWDVGYQAVRGDPAARASYLTLAVFDLPLGPRSRLMSDPGELPPPGGPAWAQTWAAIDVDGDTSPDFALVGYTCDRDGTAHVGGRDAFCAEYWFADGGVWTRQRVDITAVCF